MGYKKGHSMELLRAKMTEEWRIALDNKHVVGIVFIDFKDEFDSVSPASKVKKFRNSW